MSAKDIDFSKYQIFTGEDEGWLQQSIDAIPLLGGRENSLKGEHVDAVLEYLRNPVKAGIWILNAEWVAEAEISQQIWQEFSSKLEKQDDKIVLKHVEGKETYLTREELGQIKYAVFNQISFYLRLFSRVVGLENKPPEIQPTGNLRYDLIYDSVDLEKVKDRFSVAYEYFKEHFYHQEFDPRIRALVPFYIKNGFIFTLDISRTRNRGRITYYSLHPDGLKILEAFLTKLNKIANHQVMPIFSPEEKVLAPYFWLAQLTYSRIIDDERLHPLFAKSFTEYEADRFESSISTLGLIGEDFLTQIYETLFREPVPKGQTMGQLYDLIQAKTAKLFQKAPLQPPDIDEMYKAINEQLGQVQSDTPPTTTDALKLLRQTITLIKEERAYNRELAKEGQKQPSGTSIFLARLRENINDLIRFRNAASHKSRVPLSDYEALRTLHCLISLVVWWHAELRAIDWSDGQETIIKKMTERNAASNA